MTISHGSYFYDLGRDENGKRRRKKICRVADGEPALFLGLAKIKQRGGHLVRDLLLDYLADGARELAPRTQIDYSRYIEKILIPQFGHMEPDDVEPGHIAQFLEWRKRNGAGTVANRERSCFSSAFEYGLRHGRCRSNPCRGVRRNRETPRDRYVRHEELVAHFEAASEPVQDLLATIYLARMRPGEARKLRKNQLKPEGIVWEESKTGHRNVCEYSKRLRFFLLRACSRTPNSIFVLTNTFGDPWTHDAMQSTMRRLREAAGGAPFTWHDLRAKGESDAEESAGLMDLYNRARRRTAVA